MIDLALKLEALGIATYGGSCNYLVTGDQAADDAAARAAFDALRFPPGAKPTWTAVLAAVETPSAKPLLDVLVAEIEAIRDGDPETQDFTDLRTRGFDAAKVR